MRPDLAAKRLAEIQSKKQMRKDFWQPVPGARPNRIRILPRWDLDFDLSFFRETLNHRNLGTERNKQAICLIAEGESKCPACELKNNLFSTKDPSDAEYAKSITARTKVYYNIVDLDDVDKGVQIWSSGTDVLEQILAYVSNPKYGDIADPQTGRNIDLYFTEAKQAKSGFNSYRVQPDPDRSEIQDPSWLEQLHDLDKLVKTMSYEALEAICYGRDEEEPDDFPPADSPESPESTPAPEPPKPAPPKPPEPPKPTPPKPPELPKPPTPPAEKPKSEVSDILARLRSAKAKK